MFSDPDHPVWDLAWGVLVVVGMMVYLYFTVTEFSHDEHMKLLALAGSLAGAMVGRRALRARHHRHNGECYYCEKKHAKPNTPKKRK
jgi:hypothetical protein